MSKDPAVFGVQEVKVTLNGDTEEVDGLVLKWRRRGDILEGLVSSEVDGKLVTHWLPALAFSPESEQAVEQLS